MSSGRPSRDPSIEHEPHLSGAATPLDAIDAKPALAGVAPSAPDDVEHTVWDEPSLVARCNVEAPEGQLTYARWLDAGVARTTWLDSWVTTLLVVLAAGPWGVVGAFAAGSAGSEVTFYGVLGAVVLAPVTEEITKLAAALWVVEKRPHWFKSLWQILACAAAGGLAFAAIENLIYTNFYVPNGGAAFRAWRWTVCVGLHLNCSVLAGFGLVRIWSNALRERRRPELALGMPYFAMAMVGHGLYNLGVTVAEAAGWLEFE